MGVVNGRSAVEQRMESVVSGSLGFGCINVRSVNSCYTIGRLYVCGLNWKTGGGLEKPRVQSVFQTQRNRRIVEAFPVSERRCAGFNLPRCVACVVNASVTHGPPCVVQ